MSLTSSLANVGRAIAYYPRLSRFFGSVNASIFFSQLYYWQSRCSDELGVYKEAAEWTEETGLSYREQATARKLLVAQGFLTETPKRVQHRIYYKLDLDKIDSAFDAWNLANSTNDENAIREMRNRRSGNAESSFADCGNGVREMRKAQFVNKEEITAETTHKTTAEKKQGSAVAHAAFVLPDWIDVDLWDTWHSTEKRKKATDKQKALAVKKLAKWRDEGKDWHGALENAAVGGWQGLFEPRAQGGSAATRRPRSDNFSQRDYGSGVEAL